MRAWRFHEFGDLDQLRLEEAPFPIRTNGDVLIQVLCASLNPADRYMVAGKYPRPGPRPFAVGRDCSGIVRETDPESRFQPGDRVVLLTSDLGISRSGTLAEYLCAPEECLAPLPVGWTPEEGAAAPLVFLTAWQALVDRGQLQAGQTVVVSGASGGVGTAAIQLAKALGARVVALSRGDGKRDRLLALGADFVVDSAMEGLAERVKVALDGGRVDLVVDNLGGDYLDTLLRVVGYGGRIMVVGLLAGLEARLTVGLLIHKCITLQGMSVTGYTTDETQQAWGKIEGLMAATGQRPVIHRVYEFESVPAAFETLASGPVGKVCIMILNRE